MSEQSDLSELRKPNEENISFAGGENNFKSINRRKVDNMSVSDAGRKSWELGINNAYLLRLNRYAYENKLITEEQYRMMDVCFKTKNHEMLSNLPSESW